MRYNTSITLYAGQAYPTADMFCLRVNMLNTVILFHQDQQQNALELFAAYIELQCANQACGVIVRMSSYLTTQSVYPTYRILTDLFAGEVYWDEINQWGVRVDRINSTMKTAVISVAFSPTAKII